MERWRSFFSKAGEDVWTIIEQAILLAAHDHPSEFKEKRCNIAETLFAARPHGGDLDATRLSASVITNCMNRVDISAARDDEHVSAPHTKVQAMHDTQQHHTEYGSAEAHNNGVDNQLFMSTIVCNIKETLDDSMQPEGAVLCGLRKLESLHISVDVLRETEIGKQVNNLRKHACKEIRLLAKSLVRHWKELVDDWVNRTGTSEGPRREMPGGKQQHCYYDVKCRDGYSEAVEERGSSSRAEHSELGRIGRLEEPRSKVNCILDDENNIDADGLVGGKSSNGKATVWNRSYGVGKLSCDDANANKLQGHYGSQKEKLSRPTINQQKLIHDEGVHFEVKLDAAGKRKPQDEHMEMENAKRQQAAHPINFRDFPQAGLVPSKPHSHWKQQLTQNF